MLLEWLSLKHGVGKYGEANRAIDAALDKVLADPARRTRDLGGALGTKEFTETVCREVEAAAA
jgi:3-isopropylmalate dehydrogenase